MTMKANRIGKIARLPRVARERLNQRIEDGEPAAVLLEWLNSLPVTQQVVSDYFDGRLITEQNLSVWRQGGFVEWQRNQERRALMREFLSEAEELGEEIKEDGKDDGEPLTDRLASMVALELAVLLREAMAMEPGAERTKAILEIARELGRLRRGDHQRRRVALEEKKWERELDEKFEAECEGMREKIRWAKLQTEVIERVLREADEKAQQAGKANLQGTATGQEGFATQGAGLKEGGVAEWPGDNRPMEQREPQGGAAGGVPGVTVTSPCSPSDSTAQSESK